MKALRAHWAVGLLLLPSLAFATGNEAITPDAGTSAAIEAPAGDPDGVHYLVPELEGTALHISDGKREFLRRASFSPGYGRFGEQEYFSFRFAYNPNSWLGWEIGLGHNPANSVHGVLHNFSAVLRYPLPWRLQPYVNTGYGMLTIYPGKTINADAVTKNALTYGGGLELYLRDDVAIRGEIVAASIMGRDPNGPGSASYTYRQFTIGFSFYRSLGE